MVTRATYTKGTNNNMPCVRPRHRLATRQEFWTLQRIGSLFLHSVGCEADDRFGKGAVCREAVLYGLLSPAQQGSAFLYHQTALPLITKQALPVCNHHAAHIPRLSRVYKRRRKVVKESHVSQT